MQLKERWITFTARLSIMLQYCVRLSKQGVSENSSQQTVDTDSIRGRFFVVRIESNRQFYPSGLTVTGVFAAIVCVSFVILPSTTMDSDGNRKDKTTVMPEAGIHAESNSVGWESTNLIDGIRPGISNMNSTASNFRKRPQNVFQTKLCCSRRKRSASNLKQRSLVPISLRTVASSKGRPSRFLQMSDQGMVSAQLDGNTLHSSKLFCWIDE